MDEQDEGFSIVTLPMDQYVDARRFGEVGEVVAEADAVAELLGRWGGEHRAWEGEDRDLAATQVRLRQWSRANPPRNSMLLWFGHGESNQDSASLAVRGNGADGEDDHITPEDLCRHLVSQFRGRAREEDCWAVVVVEACGAARFVDLLLSHVLRERAAVRLLLIGSGADQGRGYVASIRQVLTTVLAEFSDNYSHIRLRDLAQRIQDLLSPGQVLCLLKGDEHVVRRGRAVGPVIMTLEDYARPRRELPSPRPPEVTADRAVSTPLAPLGTGFPGGELSWFFVGRAQARDRIAAWLASADHGVLAVTGPPGCGKSALLGHILLQAGRPEVPPPAGRAPRHEPWPDDVPRPRADAFLNLTGASVRQIVRQLAQVFAVPVPPDTVHDDERIRAFLDEVGTLHEPRTLFADALDASSDPNRLADLLRALGALSGVRVVVGTRPSSADTLDVPGAVTEDLLNALGCATDEEDTLRLTPDPQDLSIYVREALLSERAAFQHLDLDMEAAVQRVGALICAPGPGTERDFLYASLAVHEIIADPSLLLDSRREDLAGLLSKDHRWLFAAVVARLRVTLPGSIAVLRALAFARGHGLPRAERIWATVASALNDTVVDAGLLEVVAQAAAPYVMMDAEDGQAVYRLAHRSFRDFLLESAGAPEGSPARPASDRLRIVTALTGLAASKDGGMTAVPRPHPYLVSHLADHAAEAGAEGWRALAAHTGVLDHLDPAALTSAVLRSGAELAALPSVITGALATAHLGVISGPEDRRGLRELGTWRTTGAAPAAPLAGHEGPVAAWTVRWAALTLHAPHVTLADLQVPMRALRVLPRGDDGRQLLVGAGDAGVVRAWDLSTGLETTPALRGGAQDGSQWVLAPLRGTDDTDWLAAAGDDRTLRLWDMATGRPAARAYSLEGDAVRAMAPFAGKLAVGDLQGRVRLFDPAEGRESSLALTGHHGPVHGMSVYPQPEADGESERLVTVDGKGWVLVWRRGRRRSVASWQGHASGVYAVAAYSDAEGAVVLATAGQDGTVRLWDPRGKAELGRLIGHDGPVFAVAAYSDAEGAVVLATAGQDGTVRLWDPRGKAELGRLIGHDGPVFTVAAYSDAESGVVLATAGQDGTVRLWDPMGRCVDGYRAGLSSAVRALTEAGGTLCVAYADGSVAGFGAAEGARHAGPKPDSPVVAMASLAAADGAPLLATAHVDGSVRLRGATGRWAQLDVAFTAGSRVQFMAGLRLADGQPAFAALTAAGDLCAWDAGTGTPLWCVGTGLTGPFTTMTVIPRGDRTALAVVGDGGHRVWWSGAPEGPWIPMLTTGPGRVAALAAVGDSGTGQQTLVSASPDGVLQVWDTTGTRLLHTVRLGLRCHALAALDANVVAVGTHEGILALALDPHRWAGTGPPDADVADEAREPFAEWADRPSDVA